MGYWETLELLQKQLNKLQSKQDYLKKQKELAIKTVDVAKELEINVRNARIAISKLLKRGEIQMILGKINKSEKAYVLTLKHFEENICKSQKK